MAGPDEGAPARRGHLRAADTDRERVVATLQAAFVQGRLDKHELDARVGQALASRTYAELAALTADIPAGPTAAEPAAAPGPAAAEPVRRPARTLAKAASRSGVCMLATVALVEGAFLANQFFLLVLATFAFLAACGFLGYGILDAWQERRAGAQHPSPPGQGRRSLARGERPGRTGRDPASPEARADRTRTDLRSHGPGQASFQGA